jgi:hypothetical protein
MVKKRLNPSAVPSAEQASSERLSERFAVNTQTTPLRRTLFVCLIIFLIALGIRFIQLYDNRHELTNVLSSLTSDYRDRAKLLAEGRIALFMRGPEPPGDANALSHPPGYAILMAFVIKLFGSPDNSMRVLQAIADSLAAVLIFLLAAELLPRGVAIVAGLLVALSPQLAYYSLLVLPDSLAIPPILLAIFLIVRATKRPRIRTVAAAGALIGLSCWLRPNAILLAPFLAATLPALFERGRRLRFSLALAGASLLVIAPVTIRNVVVFRSFVPLSLGSGITLIEGIADYDTQGRFRLPATDTGVMRMEADAHQRPDYYGTLYAPDGIERERARTRRALSVIRSHPMWFVGVMFRRAASMLRLARTSTVSGTPPVSHTPDADNDQPPFWTNSPVELKSGGTVASKTSEVALAPDERSLRIIGDESTRAAQFISAPIYVQARTDYRLRLPARVEKGRLTISVLDASTGEVLAAITLSELEKGLTSEAGLSAVEILFASGSAREVRVVLSNGGSSPVRPVAELGRLELFTLGPTAHTWTSIFRPLIRGVQRLFITAFMLPLMLVGIALLIFARRYNALLLLIAVPAYYLIFQSPLHTEYRYVAVIHYFFFVLVAVSLYWLGGLFGRGARSLLRLIRPTSKKLLG